MLPPLREVPLEPLLSLMQMEVCSSAEYPHQSGFPQTRHRRCLVTLQKPFVVSRCCCGELPTEDCLVLGMWTDIYPLCSEFSGEHYSYCFKLLLIGRRIAVTLSVVPKVLSFGLRLIFSWLDGARLSYDFHGGGGGGSFCFFFKQ